MAGPGLGLSARGGGVSPRLVEAAPVLCGPQYRADTELLEAQKLFEGGTALL